jgi:hypothetical protein
LFFKIKPRPFCKARYRIGASITAEVVFPRWPRKPLWQARENCFGREHPASAKINIMPPVKKEQGRFRHDGPEIKILRGVMPYNVKATKAVGCR